MPYQDNVSEEALQDLTENEDLLSGDDIILNVITVSIIAISLTGNGVVCFRLIRDRQLRKEQLLFLNLAVADMLDTLMHSLYWLILFWMRHSWFAGDVFCRIMTAMQVHIKACSGYLIVALAADLYLPLFSDSPRNGSKTLSLAIGAWMVALAPALPHLYLAGLIETPWDTYFCTLFIFSGFDVLYFWIYWTVYHTVVFVLPVLLCGALYSKTMTIINPWTYSLISISKGKTLNTSFTLFALFLVVSIPHVIERLLLVFSLFRIYNSKVDTYLFLLYLSRSSLDPLIYLAFNWRRPFCGSGTQGSDSVPSVMWRADSLTVLTPPSDCAESCESEQDNNAY